MVSSRVSLEFLRVFFLKTVFLEKLDLEMSSTNNINEDLQNLNIGPVVLTFKQRILDLASQKTSTNTTDIQVCSSPG